MDMQVIAIFIIAAGIAILMLTAKPKSRYYGCHHYGRRHSAHRQHHGSADTLGRAA